MADDAFGIDGRALRWAPGRARRRGNVATAERTRFALVLGVLRHLRAEGGLVGELARMAVEVGVLPFGDRPADAPAGREIIAAVACRQHGEGGIGNARGEEAIAAPPERNLGEFGG